MVHQPFSQSAQLPPSQAAAPPLGQHQLEVDVFRHPLQHTVTLAQRGTAAEHGLHVAPIKLGQQAEHVSDQQILLKDRGRKISEAEAQRFFDGTTLGG